MGWSDILTGIVPFPYATAFCIHLYASASNQDVLVGKLMQSYKEISMFEKLFP